MDLNELMKNPDQIQQLISVLQALLPKDSNTSSDTSDTPDEATAHDEDGFTSAIKTKSSKRFKKQSANENKFLSMPEKDMFKEDTKIDQMLNKHPPVSRNRDFDPIEVICRICGKKELVSPALAGESPKRYKCNNCSTSAG